MKKYSASDSTWNRSKKCPIRPTETEVAFLLFKMWYFLPSNLYLRRRRKTGDDDAQIQLRVRPVSSGGDFQTAKLLVFEDFFGFDFFWSMIMAASFWSFSGLSKSDTKQEKEVWACLLLVFSSIPRHNLFWLFSLLLDVRYEGIYLWSTVWEYNEILGVRIFTSLTFWS